MPDVLSAPLVVEFPFTRSLGPVQSAFLTGLRERVVLGVRTTDGRTLVPPVEYDPRHRRGDPRPGGGRPPTGTVTTWAWNHAPRRGQPLTTPFAWVLVRLDGADTALLHALDAPGPDAVRTGMRVRVRWAEERTGAITDIACFEPYDGEAGEPGATGKSVPAGGHSGVFGDPITGIVAPARLDYTYSPGRAQSAYIEALSARRTVGERCPSCRKVYVPPRGACPHMWRRHSRTGRGGSPRHSHHLLHRQHQGEEPRHRGAVRLRAHRPGRRRPRPARPHRRHPHDQVRMGLRVAPVWTEGARYPDHYRPTGEPDAAYETYKELL